MRLGERSFLSGEDGGSFVVGGGRGTEVVR